MTRLFAYYIADPCSGEFRGTDDIDVAMSFSRDDCCFVLERHTGKMLIEGVAEDVLEVTRPENPHEKFPKFPLDLPNTL